MERFHFTIKQKLQILDMVRTGQLARLVALFPSITQKQLDEWQRNEERMRMLSEKDQCSKYTLHAGPSETRKELYQYLYQKVKELRQERKAITVESLISLAIAVDPSLQQMTFSGQKSMIRRFMECFKLSVRQVTGTAAANEDQMAEEEKTAIDSFKAEYHRIVQTHQIPAENIYNMDQSGILYENIVSRTIDFAGSREVPVQSSGDEKKRITLFSLMNALGELFPQLVVYKGTRDAIIKTEVEYYDDLTTFHTTQENAWCDGFVLIEWLYKFWHPMVRHIDGPKLLILDSYPLHEEFAAKFAENNTHVLFVPKGLTWSLQPLDCGHFKVFKDHLKRKWVERQNAVFLSEQEKRAALSTLLKETYEIMGNNDNTVFWKKAGLEPPHVYINRMEEENRNDEMEIESQSDDNLFA